jgi:hypothetical protein
MLNHTTWSWDNTNVEATISQCRDVNRDETLKAKLPSDEQPRALLLGTVAHEPLQIEV